MNKALAFMGCIVIFFAACSPIPTAQPPGPSPVAQNLVSTVAPSPTTLPPQPDLKPTIAPSLPSTPTCSALFNPFGFSAGGKNLYGLMSVDGVAKTWLQSLQMDDLSARTLASAESNIAVAAISPDRQTVAWAWPDFTIQLLQSQDGKLLTTFKGHEAVVNALLFSPDGTRLYSASSDGSVIIWETSTHVQIKRFEPTFNADNIPTEVLGLGISPNGKTLLTIPFDGSTRAWDMVTFKQVGEFPGVISGAYSGAHADFSPDGHYLAIGLAAGPGDVILWQVADRTQLWSGGMMAGFAFSPDGRFFAHTQVDDQNRAQLVIRSADGQDILQTISPQSEGVPWRLLFSPDSTMLASITGHQLNFWNVADGTLARAYSAPCPGL